MATPIFHTSPHRYDRLRLAVGLLVPLIVVVLLAAACGNDDSATGTGQTTTTLAGTTTTDPAEPEPTDPGDVPECDQSDIEEAIERDFGSGDGPAIEEIEITNCEQGHARVIIIPVEPNFESEQVFMRKVGGLWEIIDFGTGITCGDDDLDPDMAAACEALGLD